jgi:large conductance mechanosensitive channel
MTLELGSARMSLASEFKEFAMKGNVIDLAVGVVIGAAFGKIVTSLVGDVVMPPLGLVIGNVNFTDLAVKIGMDAKGKEVLWRYGAFIQTIFEFLIIAVTLFVVIKGINRLKRPPPAHAPDAPPPTRTEQLLQEIRDELAKK